MTNPVAARRLTPYRDTTTPEIQHGRYVFKRSVEPLDTRTLRNGVYDRVVTVSDIAGHRAVARIRFTVDNGPDV